MRKIYSLLFFFLLLASNGNALTNTDSIFAKAIEQSKGLKYTNAIVEAKKALVSDTLRADIMVYIANVYSWQEKNDSALMYIEKAKQQNYFKDEMYDSWTNILLRSKRYDELLKTCDEAEKKSYKNKDDLLKKRLLTYTAQKEIDKGIELAELDENSKLIKKEPVSSIYSNLLIKKSKETVSFNYSMDAFDSIASHHLASLGYFFKVGEHTWGFRANYANRFAKRDVQLESDFYLQLINEEYIYFNYGYAFNAQLFPQNRLGFEYYFSLKKKADASLGMRYMYYLGAADPNLYIVTGHIAKSFTKSSIALRPYYVIQRNQKSLTFIANYRHFGKSELDYWGLELGFGNSPDDMYATGQNGGFNQLSAFKFKIEKNFIVNRTSELHVGLGYTSEQFNPITPQIFRNRYTIELGYKIRL